MSPVAQKTKPGTPRLSEVARHVVVPDGIVGTSWPRVRETCRNMGIEFETWQDGIGRAVFGKRKDGTFAASVGGIVLSIPRQVGKTYLIGSIAFAMCLITPKSKVIWTAHHSTTADETFDSMAAMAERPKIARHVRSIRRTNGEQRIIFRNGSRVEFGARERGFGRGKQKVTALVLDEAQILSESAMENLVPTLNRGVNPLLFMMGTPPRPLDPGDTFINKRKRAIEGKSKDTLYVEFSADQGAKIHDREQWRKANPSYPHFTPASAMERMLESFGQDGFYREALGIWDEASLVPTVIDPDAWSAMEAPIPDEGKVAYGVKFSSDGNLVALGVALVPEVGAPFVEVVDEAPTAAGIGWIVTFLTERWRDASGVVIDGKAYAGELERALLAEGVQQRFIVRPTVDQVVAAHAGILESIRAGNLAHAAQPGLDASVKAAGRRAIGTAGGWGFAPITDGGDVTPIEAVTLALYGAVTSKRKTSGRGRSSSGRRAVVM